VEGDCPQRQGIFVVCGETARPPSLPLPEPRRFISIVLTSNFTGVRFARLWAGFYRIAAERVQVLNHFEYRMFTYVNWTFAGEGGCAHGGSGSDSSVAGLLEGHGGNGDAAWPAAARAASGWRYETSFNGSDHPGWLFGSGSRHHEPLPGSGSAHWTSFNGSDLFPSGSNSFGPSHDFSCQSSEMLELITTMVHPATLWNTFGIFEQRENISYPNGPVDPNRSTWTTSLSSAYPSFADRFGSVVLHPGRDAFPGSICNFKTDRSVALPLCRQHNRSYRTAILIPYFRSMSDGVIYISEMNCSSSTFSSCNFTMSYRYKKNNPCTHLQDIGVLCGTNVVDDPPQPISYAALVEGTSPAPHLLRCLSWISGIPGHRFLLLNVTAANDHERVVNFTFTPAADAVDHTRGDLDLILQNVNEWAYSALCGVKAMVFSDSIGPSESSGSRESHEPSPPTEAPPTRAPPTGAPPTGAPPTGAPPTTAVPAPTSPVSPWVTFSAPSSLTPMMFSSQLSSALEVPQTQFSVKSVVASPTPNRSYFVVNFENITEAEVARSRAASNDLGGTILLAPNQIVPSVAAPPTTSPAAIIVGGVLGGLVVLSAVAVVLKKFIFSPKSGGSVGIDYVDMSSMGAIQDA
jgi:hypothetical protein